MTSRIDQLSPQGLVLKLLESPFTSEVVDFPRLGPNGKPIAQVRLRVLEFGEQQAARYEAIRSVGERFKDLEKVAAYLGLQDPVGSEVAAETLARACYEVEPIAGSDPPRFTRCFQTGAQVSAALTSQEIAELFAAWLELQTATRGDETRLTEAEVSAWVGRLKEGLRGLPFSQCDSRTRDRLLSCMAERLSTVCRLVESSGESCPQPLRSLIASWASDTTCSCAPLPRSSIPEAHEAVVSMLSP